MTAASDAKTISPAVDQKQAAIVDAAHKMFLARGFDAASMDAIALEAGVSKRTVYNRFRSKEELFAATIEDSCRAILPVDIDDIESSLPPRQVIEEMARLFVHGILNPEAIALRRIAAFEAARTPELGRAYIEHGPRWMVSIYAPMLERLAARSGLKIEDPTLAVLQLGALLTEPLYTEVLMGVMPADMEQAMERQIQSGLAAFWKIYDV